MINDVSKAHDKAAKSTTSTTSSTATANPLSSSSDQTVPSILSGTLPLVDVVVGAFPRAEFTSTATADASKMTNIVPTKTTTTMPAPIILSTINTPTPTTTRAKITTTKIGEAHMSRMKKLSASSGKSKLTPVTEQKIAAKTTTTTITTPATTIAATTTTTTTLANSSSPLTSASLSASASPFAAHSHQTSSFALSQTKLTENKCSVELPTKVSYLRELEAKSRTLKSTIEVLEQKQKQSGVTENFSQQTKEPFRNRRAQCELLEYTPGFNTTTKDITNRLTTSTSSSTIEVGTSLAARKTKLKLEFLKDFNRSTECTEAEQQQQQQQPYKKLDLPRRLLKVRQDRSNTKQQQLSSITAEKDHPSTSVENLADTIPTISTTISTVLTTTTATPTCSLIAQRKLDLKRKFEQQSTRSFSPSPPIADLSNFPKVEQLVQKFDTDPVRRKMIVNPNQLVSDSSNLLTLKPDMLEQRNSPLSDEGCNLGQSPYSSDNEDNESVRTTSTLVDAQNRTTKRKDKVARSASSDSALGLDVDDAMEGTATSPGSQPQVPTAEQQQKRRMTLTVTDLPLRAALLPLAEPTALPDSPTMDVQQALQTVIAQTSVPSKVLLEERVVEIPEEPRYSIGCDLNDSRRESSQSCVSDYPISECGAVRFVRTPSVVVSDYSDDVMCGITLEEIEYFRAQRMRRRRSSLETSGTERDGDASSDVSNASSCSNLYYCGSTISALDGAECYINGQRLQLERKTSDSSTYSVSGDEDTFTIPEQPEDPNQMGKDLADMLAAQHLSTKRAKKVGLLPVDEGVVVQGDNMK